jgi:hypothetical protein
MRLSEWKVKLTRYSDALPRSPFAPWGTASKRLGWYQGYNDVKHDRDREAAQGKLTPLLSALGAVYILVMAQFGEYGVQDHSDFSADSPTYPNSTQYVPPFRDVVKGWIAKPFF